MLFFISMYFGLGVIHQICEYMFYWSYGSWTFERQALRDFNVELGSPFRGHELENLIQRHIFEIRKMVFWSTLTWPVTFGRLNLKKGSPLDEYTRRRMLVALFTTLNL